MVSSESAEAGPWSAEMQLNAPDVLEDSRARGRNRIAWQGDHEMVSRGHLPGAHPQPDAEANTGDGLDGEA